LKLVGDAVQPANHGAKGIQTALAGVVQWAHYPHNRVVVAGLNLLAAYCLSRSPDPAAIPAIQSGESFPNKHKFQIGMVMKMGQAAVILAPVALKPIVCSRFAVLPVHVGKYPLQPVEIAAENSIRQPGRQIHATDGVRVHSNHRVRKK
jgi:hypothetical protein